MVVSYGKCWNGVTLGNVNTVERVVPAVRATTRWSGILSCVLVKKVNRQQHDGWRASVRGFIVRNGRAYACFEGHSFGAGPDLR